MTNEPERTQERYRPAYPLVGGIGLGVVMLDTTFPRPPGDVGNALTWPFPVSYRVVRGATSGRVIQEADPTLLEPFLAAARSLADEGAPMITTSCGFLARYQREMSAEVRVPVLTSALLQVPLAARLIHPGRRVGILTMSGEDLTEAHFEGVGWSAKDIPVTVTGLDPTTTFRRTYLEGRSDVDASVLGRELEDLALGLLSSGADIGAIVLECTNFVPYAGLLRRRFGLPVFDLFTLTMAVRLAAHAPGFRWAA